MKGIAHRRKKYVEVLARFTPDGSLTPLSLTWDDGRTFSIDRVLEKRRAASLKAGGIGVRYLCQFGEQKTYLFFEDPAWFVEEKVAETSTY